MDYDASGGREIFLSFEDEKETLFGLLRLRVTSGRVPFSRQKNGNAAIVRELHIFGPEVPITEKLAGAAQHRGLGKALLAEAERIARDEFSAGELAVLSGTGAKEYYRTEGYNSVGNYMVKSL
jgi:elongator complex protein 3